MKLLLLLFVLSNSLIVLGQQHDNLVPLFYETTEMGTYYRAYYDKLSAGLGNYPYARTFSRTTFPELTSIEETKDNSLKLFYRGFKERTIKDSEGNVKGYKKPQEIIKSEKPIDTLFAKTIQRLFSKAISKTSYGDSEIIITHPTYYYFYTWITGQGIICGRGESGLSLPRIDRLIALHEKLIQYAKSKNASDLLRQEIISEAESLITEWN